MEGSRILGARLDIAVDMQDNSVTSEFTIVRMIFLGLARTHQLLQCIVKRLYAGIPLNIGVLMANAWPTWYSLS